MKEIQWRYSTPEAVWQTGTPISAKGKANLRLNGIEYQKMFGFGGCFNEQAMKPSKLFQKISRTVYERTVCCGCRSLQAELLSHANW